MPTKNHPIITLTKQLVSIDSITPNDKGVQELLINRLEVCGFTIHRLKFGEVDNFFAYHGQLDNKHPLFVFAGHTDVVPVANEASWQHPPFEPIIKEGLLYGRGVADMKGGIAAFVVAVEQFLVKHPNHKGSIGFLITSDEEGPAIDGTIKVMQWLKEQNIQINYCLVGEPSSTKVLGDVIKNGRRGSLNGALKIIGKQGHIAYPHLANNPIHLANRVLEKLIDEVWDKGNEYFPATSFQISNLHSGTGVTNVTPQDIEIIFNFRYSTEQTHQGLKARVENILKANNLNYKINWQHSGYPFLTPKGELVSACVDAIKTITGTNSQLSTTGGTSDGRFIALSGAQVVELGVLNATIHQVDECASVSDLEQLGDIYAQILVNLLV